MKTGKGGRGFLKMVSRPWGWGVVVVGGGGLQRGGTSRGQVYIEVCARPPRPVFFTGREEEGKRQIIRTGFLAEPGSS